MSQHATYVVEAVVEICMGSFQAWVKYLGPFFLISLQ